MTVDKVSNAKKVDEALLAQCYERIGRLELVGVDAKPRAGSAPPFLCIASVRRIALYQHSDMCLISESSIRLIHFP